MTSRPPTPPPTLPGYEYESLLGSGGFADVFLYRQQRPQRRVAIKVLLASILDEAVHRQFDAEANVMATMSTHPSIVTIYQADVSADHRPYLVMEYCPRPNYGVRFRKERISVAEALRVGVLIAGAVETAHRAGILHRDIKPANILVTDYNRPALTDFGISMATGGGGSFEDSLGMSIPWSPPEYFADPPRADARSDVFSLAATVYSLLASHTPFENTSGRNTAADLIHRIETAPLRPLGRPDAPPELDRVLSTAMAKDPAGRYDSALAFGRALQQIEQSLALPITAMDVLDDGSGPAAVDEDEDELDAHTRIRRVATVDPEAEAPKKRSLDRLAGVAPALHAPRPAAPTPSATPGSAEESTVLRPAGAALAGARPGSVSPLSAPEPVAEEPEEKAPVWPWVLLASLLVIGLGVGATLGVRYLIDDDDEPAPPPPPPPTVDLQMPPNPKIDVFAEAVPGGQLAKAQLSWSNSPGAPEGTYYQVRWDELPDGYTADYGEWQNVHGRTSVVLDVPPNLEKTCFVVRAAYEGSVSQGTRTCVGGDGKKDDEG